MQKNFGFDYQKELAGQSSEDWQFGALSVPCLTSIPPEDREGFLPKGELQKGVEDFMDCASRSPLNILEAKFQWLLKNKMSNENSLWLLKNGYLNNGKIEFSDRFIAILSDTTRSGNSLKSPLETIRKKGLIPKAILPKRDDMTFDQYHDKNAITSEMLALGLEFAARFTINYEKAYEIHFGDLLLEDFLNVAGFAWPVAINGEYPRTIASPNHAFVVFKTPKYFVYDSYEESVNDWIKKLSSDYDLLDYGYRVYIAKESMGETKQLNWLQQVIWSLSDIIAGLFKKKNLPVPELPKPPEPIEVLPVSRIKEFGLAIQSFEGWYPGSRSKRNNNPGNLKWTSYTKSLGATKQDSGSFCVFPSYEIGFQALCTLLTDAATGHLAAYSPNMTLTRFFEVYAPLADKNKPDIYSKHVADKLKISVSTKIKDLL